MDWAWAEGVFEGSMGKKAGLMAEPYQDQASQGLRGAATMALEPSSPWAGQGRPQWADIPPAPSHSLIKA